MTCPYITDPQVTCSYLKSSRQFTEHGDEFIVVHPIHTAQDIHRHLVTYTHTTQIPSRLRDWMAVQQHHCVKGVTACLLIYHVCVTVHVCQQLLTIPITCHSCQSCMSLMSRMVTFIKWSNRYSIWAFVNVMCSNEVDLAVVPNMSAIHRAGFVQVLHGKVQGLFPNLSQTLYLFSSTFPALKQIVLQQIIVAVSLDI